MASLASIAMKSVLEETFGGSQVLRMDGLPYQVKVQCYAQNTNVGGSKGVAGRIASIKESRHEEIVGFGTILLANRVLLAQRFHPAVCVLRSNTPPKSPRISKAFQRFSMGPLVEVSDDFLNMIPSEDV